MYDFIVAGAGPVGCYLAWKLSDKWDVALLEEHNNIGVPVACSGMLSREIWNHIPKKDSLIQNKINGVRAHLKGKTHEVRKRNNEAFVLNRQKLDEYIAYLAKSNGVKILMKSRLNSFEVGKNINCDVSGKEIKAKMLAGCDGPLSVVRKGSGIKNPNFVHGVFGYTKDDDFDDMVDVWYDVPGFFSWKVPRGKAGTEWGLAVDPKLNAMNYYKEFQKRHNLEGRLEGIHSGLIPWGNIPLTGNKTFLCGDAGSQVKPYSGGGIMYGIMGADIAAKTIDPNDQSSLKNYQNEWNRKMRVELFLGRKMKWLYSHHNLLGISLKILEKMNYEKLHMDKPSTILGPRRN